MRLGLRRGKSKSLGEKLVLNLPLVNPILFKNKSQFLLIFYQILSKNPGKTRKFYLGSEIFLIC